VGVRFTQYEYRWNRHPLSPEGKQDHIRLPRPITQIQEQEMKSTKNKPENPEDGIIFEVGATYENMKGVYEVISIEKNSMVIRWNDGSQVVTTVDLQKRIIDRMAYERELRQQQEKTQKKQKRK
jgi:hypothetical protein